MSFALLVPAAGSGERLGASTPKALIELGAQPIFLRALTPFLGFRECVEVMVAVPESHFAAFDEALGRLDDSRVRCVAGGASRQDSVGLALDSVSRAVDTILVHDAARPFVTSELIARTLEAVADDFVAALPGLPVADTLKRVDGTQRVVETLPRDQVYSVQTPQAIRADVFREAHRRARKEHWLATDDVALIERYALGPVRIVGGDALNFKITTPFDLERARSHLR